MAKGNLILGTAKNSIGDVVMYRREGAQITRVRVRNVKNPKTDAQSFQRAIMAPIARFYSPLSVVLERSFEGLSKAKSHNKFNQVNANLARKNKWALPKGTGFFPLPYQVSQGTLPALNVSLNMGPDVLQIDNVPVAEVPTTIGELSTAFNAAGYKDGDIVTIIIVDGSTTDIKANFVPKSFQFALDSTSEVTIANALPAITFSQTGGKISLKLAAGTMCAGTVIVARFDGSMWRRSTQSVVVYGNLLNNVTDNAQVAAAIASYGMTAGDGNPLVYLDGDELADGE